MPTPDISRIERDLEDLIQRVRTIENASSPYAQQMLGEFRDLQRRVNDYSEKGTPHSRRELTYVERRIEELKKELEGKADAQDVRDMKEETRSNRTMVRSALWAAALSLAASLLLFLIERAINK